MGQRDPWKRLNAMKAVYDFNERSTLTVGCNGGVIEYLLSQEFHTKWSVGFDYDPHKINSANHLKMMTRTQNNHFFAFDLEKQDLDVMNNYLPEVTM